MKKTTRIMLHILFVLYMYALFKIILFKFNSIDISFLWDQLQRNLGNTDYILNRLQSGNFTVFETISNYIQRPSIHNIINIFGNILIFMPFGAFLLSYSKNKGMTLINVLALSLSLSLCLECLQVVFTIGAFDVDDLILNTFGGCMGCIFFKLCHRILKFREWHFLQS